MKSLIVAAGIAAAALALPASARTHVDIGVGLNLGPPVVYGGYGYAAPAPVYVAPPPVYYVPPPVYYTPAPGYYYEGRYDYRHCWYDRYGYRVCR
jgi:hypothetical protein